MTQRPARPPRDYTTKIPARRTATECQHVLMEFGAPSVTITTEDRNPAGLSFELDTAYGRRAYRVPVHADGVRELLRQVDKEGGWPPSARAKRDVGRWLTPGHARDVAWRIMLDWLKAQLAIIAARQVTADEVLLPYMLTSPDTTVYQAYAAEQAALGPGQR